MRYLRYFPLFAALLWGCVSSCTDDTFYAADGNRSAPADGTHVYFNVLPPTSEKVTVSTRQTTALPNEKDIYTMRVMVFDNQGRLIPEEVFSHFDHDFNSVFFGKGNIDETTGNLVEESQREKYDPNEGFTIPCITETVYYCYYRSTNDKKVLITDEKGNPLYEDVPDGYTADEMVITLDPAANDDNLKKCQIWVLANMGRWEHSVINHADDDLNDLVDIETIDQLKRFYGKRTEFRKNVNREFLPMVGTVKSEKYAVVDYGQTSITKTRTDNRTYSSPSEIDLTSPTTIGNAKKIEMEQIVTKVRFNIEVGSWTDDDGNTHPYEFYFDNWTVENLPRYTYIIPHKYDIYDYIADESYTHRTDFLTLMKSNLNVSSGDVKYMFYPNDDVFKDETEEVMHNGNGDGSFAGQDWIGVDADCGGEIDNGAYGIVPNEVVYKNMDNNTPEYVHIEKDQDGEKNNSGRDLYYYSFYTYGNRRGNGLATADIKNLGGTTVSYDANKQQEYAGQVGDALKKTLCAPAHASFLVIKGMVRKRTSETQVEVSSVIYKIALGGDMQDDYNLYRNTCYTYRIKINGMTQDDMQVTVNTDDGGKVTSSNYNSSVHKRVALNVDAPHATEFDAHYDLRYIQVVAGDGDIELQLFNTEADAKHIEAYYADGTQYDATDKTIEDIWNDVNTIEGLYIKSMGTKTNKMTFYNDENNNVKWLKLVDKGEAAENIGYRTGMGDEDARGYSYGTITSPFVYGKYRAGQEINIFACVEDWFPDDTRSSHKVTTDVTGEDGITTRSAWLMVKYSYQGTMSSVLNTLRDNPGQTLFVGDENPDDNYCEIYTFIELKQWEPISITVPANETEAAKDLLVERFEEYAWHLDPRTTDDYSKDGLIWGWGYSDNDYHDFSSTTSSDNGLNNTQTIVGTSCNNHNAEVTNPRWNDYAARYCYWKSQSDANGVITNSNLWYLPSINELISIEESISTMNGKEYWSSTVPTDSEVKQKPDFSGTGLAEGILSGLWNWFIGNRLQYNQAYGYYNVAKAALNGEESKTTDTATYTLFWSTYSTDIEVYNQRTSKLHVRAVRVAPTTTTP